MFLTDKLLEIGRSSNKRNNASMRSAMLDMFSQIVSKQFEHYTPEQTDRAFRFASEKLLKEGYPYFTMDHFYEMAKEIINNH